MQGRRNSAVELSLAGSLLRLVSSTLVHRKEQNTSIQLFHIRNVMFSQLFPSAIESSSKRPKKFRNLSRVSRL